MNADPFLTLRIIFIVGLILTLAAGVYLAKNFERVFGADPDVPSESSGERFYTKTEIFIVWGLTVKLFLIAALVI